MPEIWICLDCRSREPVQLNKGLVLVAGSVVGAEVKPTAYVEVGEG